MGRPKLCAKKDKSLFILIYDKNVAMI